MEIRDSISKFFILTGFKLIESDTSGYFGDYYDIYTNGSINFRLVSNRSILSIEISNDNQNWYDLALVKALLRDEKKLDKGITFKEYRDFLQTEFTNIVDLFNDKNYPTVRKRLKELENKRVKQMFPSLDEGSDRE